MELAWVISVGALAIVLAMPTDRGSGCDGSYYNFGYLTSYDCFWSSGCSEAIDWCEHDTCSCPEANIIYCVGYYYCGVYSGCIPTSCSG